MMTQCKPIRNIFSSGLMWLWLAALVIVVDRGTKWLALHYLVFQEPLTVLPVFNLTLAFNKGAAFSFLDSASGWQHILLGGLAVIVSAAILVWLARASFRAIWMNIALCLILGGALGNAWDRILYGYVIDFLSFHWGDWYFAIFNIADSAIFIGACMTILWWVRHRDN